MNQPMTKGLSKTSLKAELAIAKKCLHQIKMEGGPSAAIATHALSEMWKLAKRKEAK